jgi:hypothetical protein
MESFLRLFQPGQSFRFNLEHLHSILDPAVTYTRYNFTLEIQGGFHGHYSVRGYFTLRNSSWI